MCDLKLIIWKYGLVTQLTTGTMNAAHANNGGGGDEFQVNEETDDMIRVETAIGSSCSSQDEVNEEKRDLEKFLRYFTYKSVQVVIQSRLGTKMHLESKPLSNASDWVS